VSWQRTGPIIDIADDIFGPELIVTAFHELAHVLYHPAHPRIFRRAGNLWNWSKCHRQAEIIGVIAWMPLTIADGLSADELMREFGVRREVAEFRASLNLWK
jgi:Zn-dependent peptidase ImmA (M78 family)